MGRASVRCCNIPPWPSTLPSKTTTSQQHSLCLPHQHRAHPLLLCTTQRHTLPRLSTCTRRSTWLSQPRSALHPEFHTLCTSEKGRGGRGSDGHHLIAEPSTSSTTTQTQTDTRTFLVFFFRVSFPPFPYVFSHVGFYAPGITGPVDTNVCYLHFFWASRQDNLSSILLS